MIGDLTSAKTTLAREERRYEVLCDYAILSGDLYRRLLGGVFVRCVGDKESLQLLQQVHEETCGINSHTNLY